MKFQNNYLVCFMCKKSYFMCNIGGTGPCVHVNFSGFDNCLCFQQSTLRDFYGADIKNDTSILMAAFSAGCEKMKYKNDDVHHVDCMKIEKRL